jgi:hypothetical protein
MYSRVDKYYSQSIFVALLSIVTFVRLLNRNGVQSWLIYALGYVITIHTHYLAAPFTILGQSLVVLSLRRTDRAFLKKWIFAQLLLPLTYLPWLMPALSHTGRIVQRRAADVTQGWRGVFVKSAYITYSFTVGETVFPWEPAAILGVPVIVGLTALGLYSLWRARRELASQRVLFVFSIVFGLLPSFGGIVLSLFAFPSVPFIDLPNHLLFALPFCRIPMAAGIVHLRRPWRWGALLFIAVVSGWSIRNYYLNQHFHNPIFVTPAREIVREIASASQNGDVIFAPKDSGVPYYHDKANSALRLFTAVPEARDHIQSQQPSRIWVVTLGRDATRDARPEEFLAWISQMYRLSQTQGYVEQDPLYRKAKEALLHRPAYRYKVLVRLYERVDGGKDSIRDVGTAARPQSHRSPPCTYANGCTGAPADRVRQAGAAVAADARKNGGPAPSE